MTFRHFVTRQPPFQTAHAYPRAKHALFHFPIRAIMVIWLRMERFAMLANPLWLTALASLITSVASLVWAVRRKR